MRSCSDLCKDSSNEALELPIAYRWAKDGDPTSSAMLKIGRSVCDHVTTDYTEVISNGHHYQPEESTAQDADDQTRQGTPDPPIRRDNSQAKPPVIRTETLSTPTTIPNPAEEKIENLANALSFYNLCILTISRIMPSPDSGPNMLLV